MIRNPLPRRTGAPAAIAGILLLAACGGSPAADPAAPEPSPLPAESAEAPPESGSASPEPPLADSAEAPEPESPPPEPPPPPADGAEAPEPDSSPAEPLAIRVDGDTVWRDVFDSVTVAEQSCIRDVLDDELDSVLDQRLMDTDETEAWEVSIFACLTPENARTLFLAAMIAGFQEETDLRELDDEEMSCLRDLVAELDIAALVADEFAGDDSALEDATTVVIGCVPDLLVDLMLADVGVDMAELSEDEVACLRDWVSSVDWAAVADDESAPESLAALEASLLELFDCVPEVFDSPGQQDAGPDDHADSTRRATAVTVGEPVQGALDHSGDLDFFTFEAVEGEAYLVEVTLESLEDSVVSLYGADGTGLALNDDRDEESLGSLISWTAPASGSYYVEVTSFDGFGLGSYTLSVTAG